MTNRKTVEELHDSLLKSFTEVKTILKAMDNPNRLQILITLLKGPLTFQSLIEKIKIKRTALANNLTILKDAMLIKKIHHGEYEITQDGIEYLQAIETAYQESKYYEKMRKEFLGRKKSIETFLHRSRDED